MEIEKPNLSFELWRSKIIKTFYAIIAVILIIEVVAFFVFLPFGLLDPGYSGLSYIKDYIIFPTLFNFIVVTICSGLNKSTIKDVIKNYSVLITCSILVFTLSIVHNEIFGVFTGFCIPIFLTILFGQKKITKCMTVISYILFSIVALYSGLSNYSLVFMLNVVAVCTILFSSFLLSSVLIAYNKANSDYIFSSYKTQISLNEAAMNDSLTGLYNQKTFHHLLKHSLQNAKKHRMPMALAIIDIDNFKEINDTYGHLTGDQVILLFTRLIKQHCENSKSYVSRYGGDEFAVIFPNASKEMAFLKLEAVRKKFLLPVPSNPEISGLTFSAGISHFTDGDIEEGLLFKQADDALYRSKENGKGQTTTYPF